MSRNDRRPQVLTALRRDYRPLKRWFIRTMLSIPAAGPEKNIMLVYIYMSDTIKR